MKKSFWMTIVAMVVMVPVVFFLVAIVESLLKRWGITASIDGFTALSCGVVTICVSVILGFIWNKVNASAELVSVLSTAAALFFSRVGSSSVLAVVAGPSGTTAADVAWTAAVPALAFVIAWFAVALPLRRMKLAYISVLLIASAAVLASDWIILYFLVPGIR